MDAIKEVITIDETSDDDYEDTKIHGAAAQIDLSNVKLHSACFGSLILSLFFIYHFCINLNYQC